MYEHKVRRTNTLDRLGTPGGGESRFIIKVKLTKDMTFSGEAKNGTRRSRG